MSDLLKEAIADAKAVRATALANAKAALEESFKPTLEAMLAEKLKSEIGDEDEAVHSSDTSSEGVGSSHGLSNQHSNTEPTKFLNSIKKPTMFPRWVNLLLNQL